MKKFESRPESRQSPELLDWIVVRDDMEHNFKDELDETSLQDYLEFLKEEPSEANVDPEGARHTGEMFFKILQTYIDKGLINQEMILRDVIKTLDSHIG